MKNTTTSPRRGDLLRYGLWALVAGTALANRQHYRMFTTWLPHLLTNSLSLLLPDAVRLLMRLGHIRQGRRQNIVEDTLVTMVHNNPDYPVYVTPLALGYIFSNPTLNIYKGRLGQMRFLGLGLDAIPHTATAFALSALTVDTLEIMGARRQHRSLLARLIQRAHHQPELASLAVLGAITAFWEYGEYRMYRYEMSLAGSREAINMQWDPEDTKRDIVTNFIGWCAAMLWNTYDNRRSGT